MVDYYRDDCCAPSEDIEICASNVRRVAELIKQYMQSNQDSIAVAEHFYREKFQPSFTALFKGVDAVNQEKEQFTQQQFSL